MKKDKNFFQGHERLAKERAKVWPTQQDAADYFAVSRVTWGQCERGNATPSGDVLAGMAQKGCDVLYILTGEKELTAEEQTMLDYFRQASSEVRRAALGALLGASAAPGSTGATQNIRGNVRGDVVARDKISKGKKQR